MDDHLVKPLAPSRLYAALLQWMPRTPVAVAAAAPVEAPADAVAPAMGPLLDELHGLLSNDDFAVGRRLKDLMPVLEKSFGDEARKLFNEVENFDYPQAVATVQPHAATRRGRRLTGRAPVAGARSFRTGHMRAPQWKRALVRRVAVRTEPDTSSGPRTRDSVTPARAGVRRRTVARAVAGPHAGVAPQ
jgi:hypothetical protein